MRWLREMNRVFRLLINSHVGMGAMSLWQTSLGASALVHTLGLGMLALVVVAHPRPSSDIAQIDSELPLLPSALLEKFEPKIEPAEIKDSSPGGRAGAAGPLAAGIEAGGPALSRVPRVGLASGGDELAAAFENWLPPAKELTESALGIRF